MEEPTHFVGWPKSLRYLIRFLVVLFLAALVAAAGLVVFVYVRYGESRQNIRRVMDGLTEHDRNLPPAATEIFRVERWRKNRDAIVERNLLTKIHSNHMRAGEWHLRWLCLSVLSKLYATEDERNALMWRDLYFGYEGYGLDFAARTYFQKKREELTIEEIVKLWTLAKAPNRFNEKPKEFERAATADLAAWMAQDR